MGRLTTFVTGWVTVVSLVSVASGSTAESIQRCLETPDHPACSKSGIARLELAKGFPPMIDYDMKELEKAWDRIIKPTNRRTRIRQASTASAAPRPLDTPPA